MTHTRTFPHEPESVPAARRFATSVLRGASPDTLEAVELMVSELATNCIRHTDSGFEITIIRKGPHIRVEATDRAGGTPRMRTPRPTDPTGRGLKIVDVLSDRWGVERGSTPGKTVWFTVAEAAPFPAARACRTESPTAYPSQRSSQDSHAARSSGQGTCGASAGRVRFTSRLGGNHPVGRVGSLT